MHRRLLAVLAGLTALLAIAAAGTASAARSAKVDQPKPLPAHSERAVCASFAIGLAHCDAHVITHENSARPLATPTYSSGYAPSQLVSAYNLPSGGAGQTVAIVDAYDNPNAESDLATYRSQFGLAPCTTANGCFKKVNQSGGSAMPTGDTGWGQEIDLDIEMVSAICPSCNILLVEATSNSFADLGVATNYAAAHANVVSNSYGGPEFLGETGSSYAAPYNHPGIAITASSGDNGYGVETPAAYNTVVAVGGTSLSTAANARGWTESAWNGAGSGCSSYVAKSSWQTDSGCSRRTVADVSAVADPNTGVAVYDSYGSTGGNNWYVFGGTSVAAPIIGAVYALAGNASTLSYPAQYAYSHTSSLFDVTTGSNGRCTRGKNTSSAYLCQARTGYDGPTGLGTPNGTGGF
jgi:subtilase family serine protease